MNKLSILKGRRARVFQSIMNAIIPRGGLFEEGAEDFDLLPRADEIIQGFDPLIRIAFPLFLNYVQISSIIRTGTVFSRLSPEKAAQLLDGMEQSPFFYRRMIILLMKLVTMLTFYESDEMAAITGYSHGLCAVKR